MSISKHQPALTPVAKALFLTGLLACSPAVWAAERGSNHEPDQLKPMWVKPMLEELSPYFPVEGKVRGALLAHPKVREAKLIANSKQIEADITQSSPYEWEAGVSLRNRKDRTVTSGSGPSMDQEVNLSRSIRLPGKQKFKDRQSESIRVLGETIYGDSLHEASLSLGQNWLECQRLESRAQLYESLGGELKAFSAQQTKRFKAGEISRIEATQAELAIQQLQIEKASNERQLRVVRSVIQTEFPALLDTPFNTQSDRQCGGPLATQDRASANEGGPGYAVAELSLDLPAQERWVQTMVKMSHPLSIQRIQTEILRDQSQMSRAERLPDPKVGVSYAMERDNAEQIIGVHVSMPLGGSVRRNQSRLASSELAHSESVFQTLTQQTRAQAVQCVVNWEQSRRAAALAENQARFGLSMVKSVERAYLLGESTATELTLVRQQSHRSRMEAIDSNYAALQAQAQMLINAHQVWDLD